MQYLRVKFRPVGLFSLKRSDATSMAARSNLVPTPYGIKMAVLRVWLEQEGLGYRDDLEAGVRPIFNQIRDLKIVLLPPKQIMVNRNGYKLRYYDQTTDKANKQGEILPLLGGFVFREWIHYAGDLTICFEGELVAFLEPLLMQVNYFGKRGCFFQYLPDQTQHLTTPPLWFEAVTEDMLVQPMDDLGAQATFAKINPFSGQRSQLGRDRIIPNQFLPLRLAASSAQYDLYHCTLDDSTPSTPKRHDLRS